MVFVTNTRWHPCLSLLCEMVLKLACAYSFGFALFLANRGETSGRSMGESLWLSGRAPASCVQGPRFHPQQPPVGGSQGHSLGPWKVAVCPKANGSLGGPTDVLVLDKGSFKLLHIRTVLSDSKQLVILGGGVERKKDNSLLPPVVGVSA